MFKKLLASTLLFLFLINLSPIKAEQSEDTQSNSNNHYLACPCPHLIAHRGASGNFPDSTELAFNKALEFNTDILEFDVHLSKDGEVVISHDESLVRITGEDILIPSTDFQEIKQKNAGFTFQNHKNEFPFRHMYLKVLSLSEFVEKFPHSRFNIELKSNDLTLAEKVSDFIKQHQLEKRVVVASKHSEALEHFRSLQQNATLTSANLYEIIHAYIAWLFNLDLSKAPYQLLQLPYQWVNSSLVSYFQQQGKQVHVWTVNDVDSIREMLKIGVDGVMTDYPELAYPVFVELGKK